jgi:hypothetical protein
MMDKRKYLRINVDTIRIRIRTFAGDADRDFRDVKDMSITGIKFLHDNELKAGDRVFLTLDPYKLKSEHLVKCIASVVRVEQKDGMYNTAVRIEKIAPSDSIHLKSIIEKLGG